MPKNPNRAYCINNVLVHFRVVSRAGLFESGSGLKLTKISGLIGT